MYLCEKCQTLFKEGGFDVREAPIKGYTRHFQKCDNCGTMYAIKVLVKKKIQTEGETK